MNPNQVFNPNKSEFGLIQTEFTVRINRNESEVGMIRIDWIGLDLFGIMPRIKSD